MNRRYIVSYLAVIALTWFGWRSLTAQEPPVPLPPALPCTSVPVPVGTVTMDPPMVAKSVMVTGPTKVEPTMRLEWSGQATVRVNQPNDYTLTVRNTSDCAVTDVKVRVSVNTKSVIAAEPRAQISDDEYTWDLGAFPAKHERQIRMKLLHPIKGTFGAAAQVTFSSSAGIVICANEPKLLVKASGATRCQLGDGTGFVATVSNPGDGVAEKVKLTFEAPEGLEHAKGRFVTYDIGNLQPAEVRTVQMIYATRTGGEHLCKVVAEGDGGLKSADQIAVNVTAPRLAVETKGPPLRYLDRKGTYTIKVTNPGDATANNVLVSDALPGGFKFLGADNGGRYDPALRTVSWFAGEIAPGQTKEVTVELQAVNTGEFVHEVSAQAARGLKSSHQLPVKVEGLSAILLEVVDLEDPIEVGGETTYEIRITNTGTKTETDLKLVCQVPDKMTFKSATGPSGFEQKGAEIIFNALPNLSPRSDATYRVTVKALTPGIAHFKAHITSTILVDPVHKAEATRIYSD